MEEERNCIILRSGCNYLEDYTVSECKFELNKDEDEVEVKLFSIMKWRGRLGVNKPNRGYLANFEFIERPQRRDTTGLWKYWLRAHWQNKGTSVRGEYVYGRTVR